MPKPMYVVTVTQEEWTWLDRAVKNGAGVPKSLRFALDSATPAQTYLVAERYWRDRQLDVANSTQVDTDDPAYWDEEAHNA